MKSTYSVAKAQSGLPALIRRAESGVAVGISRHSETVAYLLSRERLEAIVETLEILSNPKAMNAIAQHRAGKTKFVEMSALEE